MTLRGHIEKGAIVLDTPASLPEGMRVEVRLATAPPPNEVDRKSDFDLVAFLDSIPASKRTLEEWAEYDRQFQAERNAWD